MNTMNNFAPVKTTSTAVIEQAERVSVGVIECHDLRALSAGELQLVGGGDLAVGIR